MGADCGAVDAVVATVRHDLGQRDRDSLLYPSFTPSPKPPIDGVPTAVFGRHIAPRRSAAEPPEYAVEDRTVLLGWSSSTTVLGLDRQQVLQDTPFCFGEVAPA